MITKKLKLFGEKRDCKGFIAEIYIQDKKMIVNSKDKKVGGKLYKIINETIESKKGIGMVYSEYNKTIKSTKIANFKPGDYNFLDALLPCLWTITRNEEFDGYKLDINKSEIFEKYPRKIDYADHFDKIKLDLESKIKNAQKLYEVEYQKKLEKIDKTSVLSKMKSILKQAELLYPQPESIVSPINIRMKSSEDRFRKEKIFLEFIEYFKNSKSKREIEHEKILKEYVEEIKKIPSLTLSEEISLGDKHIRGPWKLDNMALDKILEANLKIILPISISVIKKQKYNSNNYYTDLELAIYGSTATSSVIDKWSRIPNKNYGFFDFIKKNDGEKYIESTIKLFCRRIISETTSQLKNYVFEQDSKF